MEQRTNTRATRYPFGRLLAKRFGYRNTVSEVSRQTGFTRPTIYKWIKNGGVTSQNSRELLHARGFDPDTFERLEN